MDALKFLFGSLLVFILGLNLDWQSYFQKPGNQDKSIIYSPEEALMRWGNKPRDSVSKVDSDINIESVVFEEPPLLVGEDQPARVVVREVKRKDDLRVTTDILESIYDLKASLNFEELVNSNETLNREITEFGLHQGIPKPTANTNDGLSDTLREGSDIPGLEDKSINSSTNEKFSDTSEEDSSILESDPEPNIELVEPTPSEYCYNKYQDSEYNEDIKSSHCNLNAQENNKIWYRNGTFENDDLRYSDLKPVELVKNTYLTKTENHRSGFDRIQGSAFMCFETKKKLSDNKIQVTNDDLLKSDVKSIDYQSDFFPSDKMKLNEEGNLESLRNTEENSVPLSSSMSTETNHGDEKCIKSNTIDDIFLLKQKKLTSEENLNNKMTTFCHIATTFGKDSFKYIFNQTQENELSHVKKARSHHTTKIPPQIMQLNGPGDPLVPVDHQTLVFSPNDRIGIKKPICLEKPIDTWKSKQFYDNFLEYLHQARVIDDQSYNNDTLIQFIECIRSQGTFVEEFMNHDF